MRCSSHCTLRPSTASIASRLGKKSDLGEPLLDESYHVIASVKGGDDIYSAELQEYLAEFHKSSASSRKDPMTGNED
jgi:hypothetical protein